MLHAPGPERLKIGQGSVEEALPSAKSPGFDNLAHGPRGKEAKKRPKYVTCCKLLPVLLGLLCMQQYEKKSLAWPQPLHLLDGHQ